MSAEQTRPVAEQGSPQTCPLRIAVCLSHFHPTIGGAERQMLQLARCWTHWGHDVHVLTRPVSGLPRHDSVDNIAIHRCIRTLSLGPLFGVTFVGSLVASLLRPGAKYDAALAVQAPWEAVATGIVRRLSGKPTMVRLANAGPFGDLRQLQRAKGRNILQWLIKRNQRFLALSCQAREELLQLGCPDVTIHLLTNGVDTKFFAPAETDNAERDRTVLFVGRLSDQKNPLSLIRSWRQVNAEGSYRLLIAGSGPLESSLRQQIAQSELTGVELIGSHSDLRDVYHRASVFVLPSLSEGCSNALLEAMASGLCPIVTDIGGNTDVVSDPVRGRLVEPGNDQQLAKVLTEVLSDREARQSMASAARTHVVAYHDLEQVARQYLDIFVEMME